jgi:hypothetical protein
MMRREWVSAVAIVLLLCGVADAAQRDAGRGGGDALTPQQVERLWDDYVLAQARTALNLNDQQFLRFRNRMLALQTLRRRLQRERNLKLRDAQQALTGRGGAADPALAAARVQEYDDLLVQTAEQLRRAYASVDEVLNVRQRVRFRAFEDRMAQKKLELLAQAREAARGR